MNKIPPNISNIHKCIHHLNSIFKTDPGLSDLMPIMESLDGVYWYPVYGCAVFRTPSAFVCKCDLKLVALDYWEFTRSISGGMFQQHAVPKGSQTIALGEVFDEDVCEIVELADRLKKKTSGQHHEKSPAFIEALFLQAIEGDIEEEKMNVVPYGGTSDCGSLTGGEPKATLWPLLWHVFEEFLEDKIKVTNAKVAYYFFCMNDVADSNSVMEAVQAVIPLLHYLNNEGVDIADKVQHVTSVRRRLEKEFLTTYETQAKAVNIVRTESEDPVLCIPVSQLVNEEIDCNIRELALKAIGQVPSRPVEKLNLQNLNLADTLSWCKKHSDKLLVVAYIEEIFEVLAINLKNFTLTIVELEILIELKNYFKDNIKPSGLQLKSEVKSRKLLIEFITVCVVHTQCQVMYPDVASYCLELSQDSLCIAVFRSKQQEDAALSVINYITTVNANNDNNNNKYKKKQYLFSATHREGTIAFARKHARECSLMTQRLEEEKDAVVTRRKYYWKQVLMKKREAQQLRDTLPGLEQEIRVAEQNECSAKKEKEVAKASYTSAERVWSIAEAHRESCRRSYNNVRNNASSRNERHRLDEAETDLDKAELAKYKKQREFQEMDSEYNSMNNKLITLKTKLSDTHKKIANVIKAPPFAVNPLPVEEEDMKVVIFFLMIPKALDLLCLCLFSSQSMLAEPTDILMTNNEQNDLNRVWQTKECHFSFIGHYNSYSQDNVTNEKNLLIYSESCKIPQHFGIQCVDNMFTESDSSMWFPSNDFSFMSATCHDPFLCPLSLSKRLYAEPVHKELQFVVDYPEEKVKSARGNIGYSKLASLPIGFSQTSFIHLFSIRAFPYTQLQRVIDSLQEDWLPLREDIVRVVLAVALGQLGKVSEGKVEVRHFSDWSEQVEVRLQKQAERLRNTPRNHIEILSLGTVARFLSSHTRRNRVSKLFSAMAENWAEMIEKEILETLNLGNYDKLQSLRAKQAMMYGYAIICQADLYQVSDAADLAKWIVKFNNCLVFSEDEHEGITHIIESVRVELAQKVHSLASLSNNTVLTTAFQGVAQCPNNLSWSRLQYCYEATKYGNHYMINLLTGCILVNAAAPGVLPQHILNDPLYKRSFGDRNFEVINMSKYCMKTRLPMEGGFTYEFSGTENVVIREILNDNDILELVKVDLSCLPKRLTALYSHWYSKQYQAVFFRGIKFNDRNISFIIKQHNHIFRCFQVPSNQSLGDYPSMSYFLASDKVCQVLSKFEAKEYIHVFYSETNNQTKWEIARYGLRFSATKEDGGISSDDNAGFILSPCQLMEGFSTDFSTYLLLEKGQDVRLLIPKGKIVRIGDRTSIEISKAPDATLGYYTYDQHPRTGEFKCSSVEARLHLAVICTAVSTLLPIPLLKATGSEFALKLLKQSWMNRPYTSVELSKLRNLQDFYYNEPGLVVQELQNRRESAELNFLYGFTDDDVIYNKEIWSASKFMLNKIEKSNEFTNKCRKGISNKLTRFHLKNTVADLGEISVKYEYIQGVEMGLKNSLTLEVRESLSFPFVNSKIKGIVKMELENSWNNFLKDPYLTYSELNISNINIEEKLEKLLSYIMNGLSTTSSVECDHCLAMNKAANFIPHFTFEDILLVALNKQHLVHFNPYLSDNATHQLQDAVITYLALIVLQNKLQRITSGGAGDIAQELNCVREWDPFKHPHWLVFEVENGIQIRPEQYQMVKHLLENPASISQLTMGSGKTRVLMPMLILEYLATKKGIPRVNVLSNISSECIDFLHEHLTASVFNLHMILQPFHRQVVLDENSIETLNRIEQRNHPAFKLVSPEHRLSLELKYLEMVRCENPAANQLKEILQKQHYVDIFDESDALLSHKYQLIYAVGDVQPLANWEERSIVVQSLLRVLNSDKEVAKILCTGGFSVAEEVSAGMYRKVVLSPESCDPNIVHSRTLLREALFDALLRSHPPDLLWLTAEHKESVLNISLKAHSLINEKHHAQLLTLHGLLGFGVLESCLEKRNRVHYGLDCRRMKRTAVPFRAADVPSDRSEFSHPDTCLLYTTLSYYYEGLNEQQVKEALQKLLELGPVAKKTYYNRIIQTMVLTPEERLQIDDVGKVDLSNNGQMSLLYNKMSFNIEMINFWLNAVVVRKDTGQYPQRIVSNSWDLAASTHIVGFSGTKDNHRLLPLQVKQHEPAIPKLLGADANMMHILLQQRVLRLDDGFDALLVTASRFDALIDTGSILAGQKLGGLAHKLLSKVSHQGVMYYKDGWQVLERRSGLTVSRKSSALKDSECFIVFDEARTRGSDTRMGKQAKALLTLGQGLARDKLVQGAGRLRQLGKGQTLVMAGTADVLRGMTEPKQVLEWVLRNTAFDTEQGLAEWANQGIQFHSRMPFIDEDWTLARLYSEVEVEEKLPVVVRRKVSHNTECILLHCEKYGQDVMVSRNGANEECERELQVEEEREQEVEREMELVQPVIEEAWDYKSVGLASKVSEVATNCKLLGAALPKCLDWEKYRVYATVNFLTTCAQSPSRKIHDTMRRAWGMIRFANNEVLLLSDMESNGLCKDEKFTRTVMHKNIIIELYNGETSYKNLVELKSYIRNVNDAKKVLKEIVQARGLWSNWSCSELKTACED